MTEPPIKKVVITREKLQDRIHSLGEQISRDYEGKELVLVSVLKGSLYFMADLSRAIEIPHQLDFMAIGMRNHADGPSTVRI
jgi:hypoxanthine phosphoribosyltransferase